MFVTFTTNNSFASAPPSPLTRTENVYVDRRGGWFAR